MQKNRFLLVLISLFLLLPLFLFKKVLAKKAEER